MTSKSRKKVLYYSPTIWGNTDFYRTTGVLPFLNHSKLILRDISHFGKINQWDLIGSEILIIQRPCTPDHLSLITLAKQCRLKIICDYDDDVLNVDIHNPTYLQYLAQRDIILKCIEVADEVWCSTQAIIKSFGKGILIPNALNTELLGECSEYNSDSNRIVWRGGSSHEADMYENANEMVTLINNNLNLDFYFIGHRFTYLEMRCGKNFTSVEPMGIMQYFDYLKRLKPFAVIFPLRDTLLNKAKSAISWYEATLVGAAYLGNTMLPEFNISGALPIEQASFILQQPEMLKIAHETSKIEVERNLTLETINKLRIESLLDL